MECRRRGFTLIELAFVVVIVAVLLMVLLPAAHRSRTASGVQGSIDRLRRITAAAVEYHLDHAGQVPLRGSGYSFGSLNGWDGWEIGGKNCNAFWTTNASGAFDESAYSRPLNAYLYAGVIPIPPGYLNLGSGPTWSFNPGHPTQADRDGLQIPVFQSPGDRVSWERHWPIPDATISGYNDMGTSYIANMKWWDDPGLAGLGFTPRFNEGTRRISLVFDGGNPSYVWAGDQPADVIPYFSGPVQGEWGKASAGVVGFADGRAAYIPIVPNAGSGPGYTFFP